MIEDRLFSGWRLALLGMVAVAIYAGLLAIAFGAGEALVTEAGPARTNFLVFWSAGAQALHGHAAAAYDWSALHAAESQAAGKVFPALPWVYPPTFLLLVAPLALLPYLAAFGAWMAATLAAYVAAIYAIVPRRMTAIPALASPLVFWNLLTTQNGFLTAALLGGSLAVIETRPLLAGVLLGALTYKPQLGILFPLVLVLTGRWRVIGSAAITAAVLAGISWLAFGAETWEAFLRSASVTADAELGASLFPLSSLETAYGLVRSLGGGGTAAWAAQGVIALMAAVLVGWIWLRPVAYPVKAAALAAGAAMVTPYLLIYDLAAAATVSAAFIVKAGLSTGFLRGERMALLALAIALLYPLVAGGLGPLGPLLTAALLALIVARVLRTRPEMPEARLA